MSRSPAAPRRLPFVAVAVGATAIALILASSRAGALPAAAASAVPTAALEHHVFLPRVDRPPIAPKFPSDLHAARARYPGIVGTELNHCRLCHMNDDRFAMNPYGRDYKASGRNFAAIEPLDSDGDGFANLTEILALTFPGYATSHPPTAP
jgi:hypothetical protein